jgi:hypothetical protein
MQPTPADVTSTGVHASTADGASILLRWYAKNGASRFRVNFAVSGLTLRVILRSPDLLCGGSGRIGGGGGGAQSRPLGRWPKTSSPEHRELNWRVALTHKEVFERYIYAGAVTRNPDAIAAMFTEDGVYDSPLVPDGHPLRHLVGRDAIRTGTSTYH